MTKHLWLHMVLTDLETELQQLGDEGRDLSPLQGEIDALKAADWDLPATQRRFAEFLDAARDLPYADRSLEGQEPDDLEAIRALRPAAPDLGPMPADLADRVRAAWFGRAAGCMLGKPLEGYRSRVVDPILKASGNLPMHRYLHSADADGAWDQMFEGNSWSPNFLIDRIDGMPEDDDMNYTVTGLAIAERYGREFTSENVADFWLDFIPILRTCTAERIAYRNLVLGVAPPESASYRNPYREWIGAQIRADFWGFWNPGDPATAADMAWRDARMTHVRNGIYGEMWAAACIAAAFRTTDMRKVVDSGLAQIPAKCRLARHLRRVLEWHAEGLPYEVVAARVRSLYDEDSWHVWTHTITNAVVVCLGLLWGEGDYGKTICRAVQPLYDTDCNGATAGSIFGAAHGTASIPAVWTDPLKDTLSTGVKGYEKVAISGLAERTLKLIG